MTARKPISLGKQARNVLVLLLIAVLFLTSSAFVDPQGQTPDPYAKPLSVKSARSNVPAAAAPALPVSAVNRVYDASFEGYWSSSDWAQYSTNVGTPLCITADCGDGGGTAGPRSGAAWAWFGGINFSWPGAVSPEYGELTQYVNFPSCGATLQFYLWIGALPRAAAWTIMLLPASMATRSLRQMQPRKVPIRRTGW